VLAFAVEVTMSREGDALRREFATIAVRRGRVFPDALRKRATAYARRERAAWRSWGAIAEQLGVAEETVRRWLSGRVERNRKVVPVEIVEAPTATRPPAQGLALVSPTGYRVEGLLSVEEAARLLRALG